MASDQLIDQFIRITSSSRDIASQYLNRNNDDLIQAVEDFYANDEKKEQHSAKPAQSSKRGYVMIPI